MLWDRIVLSSTCLRLQLFLLLAVSFLCALGIFCFLFFSPPSFLPVTLKMISALRFDGCLDFQNASRREGEVRGERRRLGWRGLWATGTGVSSAEGIYKRNTAGRYETMAGSNFLPWTRLRCDGRGGEGCRNEEAAPSSSLITVQLTHLFQHTHLQSISSSALQWFFRSVSVLTWSETSLWSVLIRLPAVHSPASLDYNLHPTCETQTNDRCC